MAKEVEEFTKHALVFKQLEKDVETLKERNQRFKENEKTFIDAN